jgi:hypothetical protein
MQIMQSLVLTHGLGDRGAGNNLEVGAQFRREAQQLLEVGGAGALLCSTVPAPLLGDFPRCHCIYHVHPSHD